MANALAQPVQASSGPINDSINIYDKTPGQSVTYNQGSLNGGVQAMPQSAPDAVSLEQLQLQQQQRRVLSASQNQLAKVDAQTDYASQSSKAPSKLYDQPAQLIQQQQQIIQQARQAGNQVDGGMLNTMQTSASAYGTLGAKVKTFMGNKTVLVLGGGNGYQRMALGDNKPFGEHAHCIIWEYKA